MDLQSKIFGNPWNYDFAISAIHFRQTDMAFFPESKSVIYSLLW
jgi:hypothetical protein